MRENGLKLLFGEEAHVVQPRCTHNPIALGAQDFVIICFKAHSIPLVLDQMRPLLGPRTRIVTAVNGIPYWYFYRHGDVYENTILDNVDPGGRQWRELGPDRAIGCIIYPATEIEAPGVIKHLYGNHFPLGEPSCDITADVRLLSDQFAAAGFEGAGARSHPRRNLVETVGQRLLQPDQRADPRYPRRHLLRSGHARLVEGDGS
jgi:2-dehydropantoate 2-reductase